MVNGISNSPSFVKVSPNDDYETGQPSLTVIVFGMFALLFEFVRVDTVRRKPAIVHLLPANSFLGGDNVMEFFGKFRLGDGWVGPMLKA